MASRKNKWRRRGRFEFRRESKRYSSGDFWGIDVLYIRIRRVGCVSVEPFEWGKVALGKTLSILSHSHRSLYRATAPAEAAHLTRDYLLLAAASAALETNDGVALAAECAWDKQYE